MPTSFLTAAVTDLVASWSKAWPWMTWSWLHGNLLTCPGSRQRGEGLLGCPSHRIDRSSFCLLDRLECCLPWSLMKCPFSTQQLFSRLLSNVDALRLPRLSAWYLRPDQAFIVPHSVCKNGAGHDPIHFPAHVGSLEQPFQDSDIWQLSEHIVVGYSHRSSALFKPISTCSAQLLLGKLSAATSLSQLVA